MRFLINCPTLIIWLIFVFICYVYYLDDKSVHFSEVMYNTDNQDFWHSLLIDS